MNEIKDKLLKHNITEEEYEKSLNEIFDCKDKGITPDWKTIIDKYNIDIHHDTIRKGVDSIYGSHFVTKYFEYKKLKNSIGQDEDKLTELDIKLRELRKERKKLQAEKLEVNRNDTKYGRFEAMYENIADAIERIPNPEFLPVNTYNNEKAYCLQFSDVHMGAKFKSITNEYSIEICKARFDKMLSETIKFVEENNVSTLYIVNNADSLQGMLRIGDVRLNDLPVVDSLVMFQKMMAEWLNQLSKYCFVKYYQVQVANHTELRLLNSSAGQMSCEDMEKIIVNYIADVLADNPRVFVNTEFRDDNLQFKILDYDVIALHGHTVTNQKTLIRDKSSQYKKFFSYAMIGHFHNSMEISVGEQSDHEEKLLCAPSIVGTCPYADSLMVGGKAAFKIHTFERGKGHVSSKTIILN